MCDLQKSIETILSDTRSTQGIAIKLLAQMVDKKFSDSEKLNARRHAEQLDAIHNIGQDITNFKTHTSNKFKGLEVVSFFSNHQKIFWLSVVGVIFLSGAGAQNIWSIISKLL